MEKETACEINKKIEDFIESLSLLDIRKLLDIDNCRIVTNTQKETIQDDSKYWTVRDELLMFLNLNMRIIQQLYDMNEMDYDKTFWEFIEHKLKEAKIKKLLQ